MIVMGKKKKKKTRGAVFGCNDDRLFPEKYTLKFSFPQKTRVNTDRVPPGHPIILLKSNKFNMAAVLVKRSIEACGTVLIELKESGPVMVKIL